MNFDMSEKFSLAIQQYETGNQKEAVVICEKIIMVDPNHSAALNLLGLILLDNKHYNEARDLFEKAAAIAPKIPDYYNNLGSLHQEQNQFSLAEIYFRRAVQLNHTHPEILGNLGDSLQAQKKLSAAIACYHDALHYSESNIRILVNLGRCLEDQGELNEAAACYNKAIAIDPNHAIALNNLGTVLEKQGLVEEAIFYYKRSLVAQPEHAFTHNNLGLAFMQIGQFGVATACFRNALAIDPGYVDALENIGDISAMQGKTDAAKSFYRSALNINDSPGLRFRLATLLPPILESEESIAMIRKELESALDDLRQDKNLKLFDPVLEVKDAFFYLAYHGFNNRNLKTQLAQLFERSCPSLLWEAPHCSLLRDVQNPIKIGIISKYLYNHSIGKTTQGFFAKLPRDRFRVYAIFVAPIVDDQTSRFIRSNADEVLEVYPSLATARRKIAALELDVLFYQDIGMDPFTYFLAFARLAPIQCTSFGHPDTTGIRNMDGFISSGLFEIENAQTHYSETLHVLSNNSFLTYYYRTDLPTILKSRTEYGLSNEKHLYICPQTLYKLHPSFDHILANILRSDPLGNIVLLEGSVANFAELLRQRFQVSMPDVADRVIFLPPQNTVDYINLIAVSDAMLDIPSFNGMNSSLEAFAVGTPIVTLPGELQRTRHGAGMYRRMGFSDCIAENTLDYIKIALRLANDLLFRREVSAKILANNHLLFEDEGTILAFSDFFERRVSSVQSNLEAPFPEFISSGHQTAS